MTIERLEFKPPVAADPKAGIDLNSLLLFAKRTEIPPGHKVEISLPRAQNKLVVRTYDRPSEQEDTVADVDNYDLSGRHISHGTIDENQPILVIACVEGTKDDINPKVSISDIIRYFPSIKGQLVNETDEAVAIPVEIPKVFERSEK